MDVVVTSDAAGSTGVTRSPARSPEARLAGQQVLVTGATGFLGSHVCARLLAAGAAVHAVSRAPRVSTHDNLRWCHADVENLDTVRRLVSDVKPRLVFHFGGLVNGAPELKLVVPTFHSLVTSTVNLLTVAAEAGCERIILVGSLEEPGTGSGDGCPTSPYGAAKWVASAYGRMFHTLFGLPVVIARALMTYGPGQPSWKVIPYTITSLLRGETPRVSSGDRELDWVYVDDVIDGLLLAGVTPGLDGSTVELGTGTLTSIRDVVAKLVRLLSPAVKPVFAALPDRPPRQERAANVGDTYARMGWRPATPLDDGLARTVEWYRHHHASPPPAEPQGVRENHRLVP